MFQARVFGQSRQSGYKLVDKGLGLWQLQMPAGVYTGSLKQVCAYAVHKLEFSLKELEIGVLEMDKHFHNAAEYGIFKRFMWSYDLEEKNEKTSLN